MKPYDDYGPRIISPDHVQEVRNYINFDLGLNLRKIRKKNGETLEVLANALNIKKSTLSKYEKGHLEIPSSYLPIIAGRYKVSISELYSEEIIDKYSQKGLFKAMVNIIFKIIDNVCIDESYYENILVNYFHKYLPTDRSDSFDIYYAVSLFLDQIDNLHIYDRNGIDFELQKSKIFNDFLLNIDKIHVNDYKKKCSVFMNDLIDTLSDNDFRNLKLLPLMPY